MQIDQYQKFISDYLKLHDTYFKEFTDNFIRLKNAYAPIKHEYLKLNKTLAEGFNIFQLLGVTHYEVTTHSAILRELLDSNGTHGQGNLFLIEFLSMLADKDIILKEEIHRYSPQIFDDYLCEAERSVETGRIDIIIERLHGDFPFCIIIENKIYAVDQYEQIERYWQELDKKFEIPERRKEIIYLTPKGGLPTEWSIDHKKRKELEDKGALHYISYNTDINNWLERALPKIESQKIKYLIEQYIEVIKTL